MVVTRITNDFSFLREKVHDASCVCISAETADQHICKIRQIDTNNQVNYLKCTSPFSSYRTHWLFELKIFKHLQLYFPLCLRFHSKEGTDVVKVIQDYASYMIHILSLSKSANTCSIFMSVESCCVVLM